MNYALVFATCAAAITPVVAADSPAKGTVQTSELTNTKREFHEQVKAAVASGHFVETSDGYELKTDRPLSYMVDGKTATQLGGAVGTSGRTGTTGTVTNAGTHPSPNILYASPLIIAPSPASGGWTYDASTPIKVQIGTVKGKAAFVTTYVNDSMAPEISDDVAETLVTSQWGKITPPEGKACADGTKCLKRCKNSSGRRYCCEYGCK